MRIHPRRPKSNPRGYVLLLVLAFATLCFLVLTAALNWCESNTKLNARNNQYFTSASAAEAATEKILANMAYDYQKQGAIIVQSKLATYSTLVPTTNENPAWANYVFSDGEGHAGHTHVERLSYSTNAPLQSQYAGLYGLASTYRIVANARMTDSPFAITSAVKQEVQLASIPIFQFAIFYNMDLEINPGANMTVSGRVHGNSNIWMQPNGCTLTFQSHVTAVGTLKNTKSPNDPSSRSAGTVTFRAEHDANCSSLTLPVGTGNSPDSVYNILDVPPSGEDASSLLGQQRYYNKADLIVLVYDNRVEVTSGVFNNKTTVIPFSEWGSGLNPFINTNRTFFNKREYKTVRTTEIDVAKLKAWSEVNTSLRPALGSRDLNSIFVADKRTQISGSTEPGVRLINGQTLPSLGLTVATPNPIYVKGHFNAPNPGSSSTANTLPASLVGDAITVLSTSWNDANGGSSLSSRIAGNTTVNAAFMAGIVPSGGGYYSGGVENFPRFLEDWGDKTLTYNGSMVVMFYSKTATAPWGGSDVYSPPSRNWTFDINFLDAAKLPPGTPQVRALIRAQWSLTTPDTNLTSTSFVL
jgi:hypothetical protein